MSKFYSGKLFFLLPCILFALYGNAQIQLYEIAAKDTNQVVITKNVDGVIEQTYKPVSYLFDSTGVTFLTQMFTLSGTDGNSSTTFFDNNSNGYTIDYSLLPTGGSSGAYLTRAQNGALSWNTLAQLEVFGDEGQILVVRNNGFGSKYLEYEDPDTVKVTGTNGISITGSYPDYTVDGSGIVDTDSQKIDTLSLDGNTLGISLERDSVSLVEIDLVIIPEEVTDNVSYIIGVKGDKLYAIDPADITNQYVRETTTPLRKNSNGSYTYVDELGNNTTFSASGDGGDPCNGTTFLDYSSIRLEAAGPLASDNINVTMLAGAILDSGYSMGGTYKIISHTQNCEVENPTTKILVNGVETGPLMSNGKTTLSITGSEGDRILLKTISSNNAAHCWHTIGIVTEIVCN